MLAQLSTLGRRRATRQPALDLSAQLLDMAPLLARLAGDDIRWHLDVPADPVHACLSAPDLERCVTAIVAAARDALPLGGRLSCGLDGSGPGRFSTEDGVTRAGVLCVVEAQGYGLTAVDLPASVYECAGALGATLRVDTVDALTCAIVLRVPRAFVVTRAA